MAVERTFAMGFSESFGGVNLLTSDQERIYPYYEMGTAAEKVYVIDDGTGRSFSSKPHDLDVKAAKELYEIKEKGINGLKVHADALNMEPRNLLSGCEGFFLSDGVRFWKDLFTNVPNKQKDMWRRLHGSFGYSVRDYASGYICLKRSYVYHKGNHKTNYIMVVYDLIHKNSSIRADDVVLCHVFLSDSYNACPTQDRDALADIIAPSFFDFDKTEVDSCMQRLEDLIKNPESFKDFDEYDSIWKANGSDGNQAKVWEHFTKIEVIFGPEKTVMLKLAICHLCGKVYQIGNSKKGSLSNNGTKILNEHNRKCTGQHQTAGNPQGADHQMP